MNVGGDVPGLRAIARSLLGVVPEIIGSGEAVSKRVDALVGDAGWSGHAADEFKGAWEQDSGAIVELSGCVKIVGNCLNDLANGLDGAQRLLDRAVSDALDSGVPVAADGSVPEGEYPADVLDAMQQFSIDSRSALTAAQDARDAASETLHEITAAMTGESTSFLKPAEAALLGALLRGYYSVPNELTKKAREKLDDFNKELAKKRFDVKSTPGNSEVRSALKAELPALRQTRKGLVTSLEDAEKVAARFKGGRLLGTSVLDLVESADEVKQVARFSRVLDSLPVLDIGVAGLATWAQAKEDHEKGWSWTHAIGVDGGSNVAGLTAGVAADFIPWVGPVAGPVAGYGVGAFTYEAGHEGHWDEHIQEDGYFHGVQEVAIDSGKATWNIDIVEVGKKTVNDAAHPVDAAKNLWHGVQDMV